MSIKYLDMYSGIGGFRSALDALGGFECVGFCEIDKYAKKAYETLYDTKGEMYFEDARNINPDDLPDIDLICAGFPCQSFSIAGNGEDLTTQEELSSLKLPELPPLKDLRFYSLRTSKTSFRMTKDGHLRPSSKSWMTSGMMSHGRCLTARISSSPNPEIECSLQDFLEDDVQGKYLLSAKQIRKLLSKDCPVAKVTEFTPQTDLPSHRQAQPEVLQDEQGSM